MRRSSLRDYFERHPAIPLAIACLAMAGLAALSVKRLDHARATVHGNWALTVTVGVATSLAVIGLTTGWFWSAYRRKVRNSKLGLALILGLAGLFVLGMAVTRQAVAPQIGQPDPVTTPVQLGAIAFMVPFYCALLALCAYTYLQTRKKRENTVGRHAVKSAGAQGDLLTALIGQDKAGGWSVTWVSDGKTPKKLSAPTLTASAERAAAAAVELLANQRASTTAELQLAIYPGPYQSGPIWEITESAGGLTATCPGSAMTSNAATLEDLLTAIQAAPDMDSNDFMLHWTRPITALPMGEHARS